MKKLLMVLFVVVLCFGQALAENRVKEDQTWYRIHLGHGVGSQALTPETARRFIDKEISTAFPRGMTVTQSHGQWANEKGDVIRERTSVIDIQCDSTPENAEKIKAIGQSYVHQFSKIKASCFVMRIPGISTQLWY